MEQPNPHVWLYSFDIPSDPPTKLRLTPFPENLSFERTSAGTPIVYRPFHVEHSEVTEKTDAELTTLSVTVSNISNVARQYYEAYDGLKGQNVRIVQIRRDQLPDGNPVFKETFTVLSSQDDPRTLKFNVGPASQYRRFLPKRRVDRLYCGHQYGSAGCGYDTTRSGALATCSKLKDGENGCTAHGDNEVAAGLPRLHPARRLIFEGLPRVSGTGSRR